MEAGDRVRVKGGSENIGRIGTITSIHEGVANIKQPNGMSFRVHMDFLEDYDWGEDDDE